MSEFEIDASAHSVLFWLSRRLPLEPKGEFAEARERLREAIRALEHPAGRGLHAAYHSIDESYFDVENVLFYNVGTGTFSRASQYGIAFDRVRRMPPAAPSGRAFRHLHEYSYVPPARFAPAEDDVVFSFSPSRVSTTTKTHHFWWNATEARGRGGSAVTGPYRLHIELRIAAPVANVAAIMKSLVDGIVASLHVDESPPESTVARLAAITGWPDAEIAKRLSAPPFPVLGPRRTVVDYREFVKWDPADHLCESLQLTVSTGGDSRCDVALSRIQAPT